MKLSPELSKELRRRGTQGGIRRELASALLAILETTHVRDIRIGDITSAVGVSQPNFYNHFRDIKEALIASAEIGWSRYPTIVGHIRADADIDDARRIVQPIIDFWIENGRSLAWCYHTDATYEPALIDIRKRASHVLIDAIIDCINKSNAFSRVPSAADPRVWAQLTLARLDSFGLGYGLMTGYGKISRKAIIDTAALMLLSDLGIARG